METDTPFFIRNQSIQETGSIPPKTIRTACWNGYSRNLRSDQGIAYLFRYELYPFDKLLDPFHQ